MGVTGVCPACGSRELVLDYSRGCIVCRNCGLVVEEQIPEKPLPLPVAGDAAEARWRRMKVRRDVRECLKLSTLLTRLSRQLEVSETVLATMLSSGRYAGKVDELAKLARNPCVASCLRRLTPRVRVVVLLMVLDYLEGCYPLPVTYGLEYNVEKDVLRRAFKRVVTRCLLM